MTTQPHCECFLSTSHTGMAAEGLSTPLRARTRRYPVGRPTLYLRRPLSTNTQCSRSLSTLCTSTAATALSTPPDSAQMTWSSGPTCRRCRASHSVPAFCCRA